MSRAILPIGFYVGYRLKKSRKYIKGRESIREAREYFRFLKGKKSRFFHKDYRISDIVTVTLNAKAKKLRDALCADSPFSKMLDRVRR